MKKPLREQISAYVMRDEEYRVPYIDTADKVGFYMSLMRLQGMGLIDSELPEDAWVEHTSHCIFFTDLRLERFLGLLLYAASLHGAEQHRYYTALYEKICSEPKQITEPKMELFSAYKKGYSESGKTLMLDAHLFDCQNVADAVRVSARMLSL